MTRACRETIRARKRVWRGGALNASFDALDASDVEGLLEAARLDPYPEAQAAAISAVGNIGCERVVHALNDMFVLASEDEQLAIIGAWALCHRSRGSRRKFWWAVWVDRPVTPKIWTGALAHVTCAQHMATTVEQLDALLAVRSEDEHLEFKTAENRYDFELLVEYCVALANEGGGRMVLGVTDRPPRRVVGTKAFDSVERTVAGIHERLHVKVTCDEVQHSSGRVLVFHVPSRPQGQPIHYKGRYMMRAGEELVPMSPDQLKRIMAEGEVDWALKSALVDCDGERVVQVLDTQCYFDLLHLPYPATREAVLERFAKERLIERTDDRWTITNLGAILFAKKLDDIAVLSRKAPRVIVYEGTSKLKTKLDKLRSKGYAVDFQGLVEFINGLVPSNEVIEQALRRQVKMFPEIAVRELVANALIHQDFTVSGMSVMVEIYDDRLEITNPGKPFISPDRFIDEYQSRNERLADLMRRLGICEEKGSGVDKVIHAAEVFQLPAPDFRAGETRTSVVLFCHKEFDQMERSDRIRATYQHCCLRYVMNEKMTNQSLRERFRLSEKKTESVSRAIRDTMEADKIKLTDPDQTSLRYRHYIPFWA